MITPLLILAAAAGGYARNGQVFACQLFKAKSEVGDGVVHTVDLRLVTGSDKKWAFQFADGRKGSASVKWLDNQKFQGRIEWSGSKAIAKISRVSVMSNGWVEGADYLWLSLTGRNGFETPAYGCHTKLGVQ